MYVQSMSKACVGWILRKVCHEELGQHSNLQRSYCIFISSELTYTFLNLAHSQRPTHPNTHQILQTLRCATTQRKVEGHQHRIFAAVKEIE